MKIVYDPPKRLSNLSGRGFDFADLDVEFFASATVLTARGGRYMAIGEFQGFVMVVIFKRLGTEAVSVISMRRANRKERKIHGQP